MRNPLSALDIEEWEVRRVAEVLRSWRLSLGPRLAEFEIALSTNVEGRHGIAECTIAPPFYNRITDAEIREGCRTLLEVIDIRKAVVSR